MASISLTTAKLKWRQNQRHGASAKNENFNIALKIRLKGMKLAGWYGSAVSAAVAKSVESEKRRQGAYSLLSTCLHACYSALLLPALAPQAGAALKYRRGGSIISAGGSAQIMHRLLLIYADPQ